jgi:hypothetical protein
MPVSVYKLAYMLLQPLLLLLLLLLLQSSSSQSASSAPAGAAAAAAECPPTAPAQPTGTLTSGGTAATAVSSKLLCLLQLVARELPSPGCCCL